MGVSQSNTVVYENLPASVQPATGSVVNYYATRQLKITKTIFVAGVIDVRRGDTITHGTETYQLVGWRDLSGRGKVMALDVEDYTA
jgi:hypothetical protein